MAGRLLAKAVGLDPDMKSKHYPPDFRTLSAQEVAPIEPYFEEDPTIKEWLLDHRPTAAGALAYLKSLFPFTQWLPRYNLQWMMGDMIGGITLGFVVVPQAMAYAILGGLRPEFGLYTSFTGAALYWLFGTSKDMAIGATAVASLLVNRITVTVRDEFPDVASEQVAKTTAALAGICLLVFGLLRLDWLIEFIPHVAIAAFVTGAAITITFSQIPSVLGITGVNTRGAPYQVFIDTCKALPRTKVDAAVGLTALFLLQLIKSFCDHMAKRQKHRARLWDTLSSIRMTFIILLYTLISFLVNKGLPSESAKFRILGSVPTGFQAAGPPSFDPGLIKAVAPELPALVIILIIEHIAIGKSFGRINNYSISTSQEIISSGVANLMGPFLGGYAATGSFSGTAVLSKAGVRTPLAGVFNGLILLLALYALTSVFFYIPMAALAGLIVHAVSNLVTPPSTLLGYWRIAPLDVIIYFMGVLIAVFHNLEVGIYVTVGVSLAVVLLRLARARGKFLGPATIYENDSLSSRLSSSTTLGGASGLAGLQSSPSSPRDVLLPLDRRDGSNPAVNVASPCPGVFIYRFTEGFNYLNQAQYIDDLVAHIKASTRKTNPSDYKRPGDRPWNEPTTRPTFDPETGAELPLLRAVIFDCATVDNIDTTAVEGLMEARAQLDRWAAPASVEWHFAGVHNSRWTRRALAFAGFGYPSGVTGDFGGPSSEPWVSAFGVRSSAPASTSPAAGDELKQQQQPPTRIFIETKEDHAREVRDEGSGAHHSDDDEKDAGVYSGTVTPGSAITHHHEHHGGGHLTAAASPLPGQLAPVYGVDRPFFHLDLATAIHAVARRTRRREAVRRCSISHPPE